MKFTFAGDFFPGGDLNESLTNNFIDVESFNKSDLRIVNLESPITNSELIIPKSTLFASKKSINILKKLNINVVNLANNHIQDKGENGFRDTIKLLSNTGIGCFGGGMNLSEASKPYYLNKHILILGYCDHGKSYLNKIRIATNNKYGVNPFSLKKVLLDLKSLKEKEKAVIYIHWGKEHKSLPTLDNIRIVKKILENEKTLCVIGMHPHLIQGYLEHNNKRAYMSIGNFVFPNFVISKPTQISYSVKKENVNYTTYNYHNVFKNTYKKWRLKNRISMLVNYDDIKNEISHVYVVQSKSKVEIKEVGKVLKFFLNFKIKFLNFLFQIPYPLYNIIEKINSFIVDFIINFQIYFFKIKQLGILKAFKFFISRYEFKK